MESVPPAQRRLRKELMDMIKNPVPGIRIDRDAASENLMEWKVELDGADDTLYAGETFKLLFKFSDQYPCDSPEVTFLGPNIPLHPHVYTNGHICLSILTEDWTPALSVESVCVSIISMLSSCKEKRKPTDNFFYVHIFDFNPKHPFWWFHDKTV